MPKVILTRFIKIAISSNRKNPTGINSPPYWYKYLKSLDLVKWAENAIKSNKKDLKKTYINWCIKYENNYVK